MIAREAPAADNAALRQPPGRDNLNCGSEVGRRLFVTTGLVMGIEIPRSFLAETAPRHDHGAKVEVVFEACDGFMPHPGPHRAACQVLPGNIVQGHLGHRTLHDSLSYLSIEGVVVCFLLTGELVQGGL